MQPREARLEHPHHVGLSDGAAVVSGGDQRRASITSMSTIALT